jgi:hypothetical protein
VQVLKSISTPALPDAARVRRQVDDLFGLGDGYGRVCGNPETGDESRLIRQVRVGLGQQRIARGSAVAWILLRTDACLLLRDLRCVGWLALGSFFWGFWSHCPGAHWSRRGSRVCFVSSGRS